MSTKKIIKETDIRRIVRNIINEMKAYHGTGAKFNKFDSSFALSGEGSNSFGPGHYFTNSKNIGKDYAMEHGTSQYAASKIEYKGCDGDCYYQGHLLYNNIDKILNIKKYDEANGNYLWKELPILMQNCESKQLFIRKIYSYLVKCIKAKDDYQEEQDWYQFKLKKTLDFLKENTQIKQRSLYQVEIPNGNYANWLDNVPSEMIEYCTKLINGSGNERAINRWDNLLDGVEDDTFENLYHKLNNLDYDATFGDKIFKYTLKRFGYVGVKYPSGTNYQTSSTKDGDMNYTVFDDNNVKITNRWDL